MAATRKPRDPLYSDRLDRALAFVADKFRHRARKGTRIPYLAHLLEVAARVAEHGGNEDQIVAAVLHDYVEDVEGASVAEVSRLFGAPVAKIVRVLSDTETAAHKEEWKPRKVKYLKRLARSGPDIKLVAACDKIYNAERILVDLRTIGDTVWQRFSAPKPEQLWYYGRCVEALARGWDHPLVGRLRVVVAKLQLEVARR